MGAGGSAGAERARAFQQRRVPSLQGISADEEDRDAMSSPTPTPTPTPHALSSANQGRPQDPQAAMMSGSDSQQQRMSPAWPHGPTDARVGEGKSDTAALCASCSRATVPDDGSLAAEEAVATNTDAGTSAALAGVEIGAMVAELEALRGRVQELSVVEEQLRGQVGGLERENSALKVETVPKTAHESLLAESAALEEEKGQLHGEVTHLRCVLFACVYVCVRACVCGCACVNDLGYE